MREGKIGGERQRSMQLGKTQRERRRKRKRERKIDKEKNERMGWTE